MRALETATGAFSPFEWAEEELLIGARASVARATYTRTHLKRARASLNLEVRSSRGGVLEHRRCKKILPCSFFCEQGKVMDLIDGGGEGGELARWVFNQHFLFGCFLY